MPKILFCCKHNRCRSRMAEALAKAHYPSWTIESAGSAPTGDVDPYAKAIVEELGLAVSSQARSVNNLPLETYDLIVTLCSDEDICPLLPASVKDLVLHVPFVDPSQKVNQLAPDDLIAHYRDVRDQLDAFCKTLDQTLIKQSNKN